MSILDRDALAASPLADLHALASELSIDGYRRLRKADLIDAIIARQGGSPAERPLRGGAATPTMRPVRTRSGAGAGARGRGAPVRTMSARRGGGRPAARRRRGRRGGRSRSAGRDEDAGTAEDADETERAGERARATSRPSVLPRTRSSRARSSCCRTAPASCGSARLSPRTTTCTCRLRRSSAASSFPGDRISGPAPRRRAGPSGSPR